MMTAKELVKICENCKTCYDCLHDNMCDVYFEQFGCYPFDVQDGYDIYCKPVNPKANSSIKINFG